MKSFSQFTTFDTFELKAQLVKLFLSDWKYLTRTKITLNIPPIRVENMTIIDLEGLDLTSGIKGGSKTIKLYSS